MEDQDKLQGQGVVTGIGDFAKRKGVYSYCRPLFWLSPLLRGHEYRVGR
jgi:hypothetical protein